MKQPVIALTMGDPAGIGPEIIARALSRDAVAAAAGVVVYGDARVMRKAIGIVGTGMDVRSLASAREALFAPGVVEVVDLANADPDRFDPGRVSGLCGKAAYGYIEAAVRAVMAGEVDAVDTAPVNKESFREAGVPFIGHTEILAGLTGSRDPLTMFETLGLRVFFLTRHVALRDVARLITRERLLDYFPRCLEALSRLRVGGREGELAVAGLNPHCGEHGLFGDEEMRVIEPAVEEARAAGLPVVGPIGPDSVFHQAKMGRFAAVLSLYHDQGHIATKTLDFDRTIALTLGLPFLRASVDHGTAFDIAWEGKASSVGMEESILVAARYAPGFRTA
jgi:4-hydroxythreonine-4-phosphate dehydrogenase